MLLPITKILCIMIDPNSSIKYINIVNHWLITCQSTRLKNYTCLICMYKLIYKYIINIFVLKNSTLCLTSCFVLLRLIMNISVHSEVCFQKLGIKKSVKISFSARKN